MKKVTKRLVLKFGQETWDKPIVWRLVKDYDLVFNILKAEIRPRSEAVMVLEMSGKSSDFARGLDYLREIGITVQPLAQDVVRNEEACVHCGACIAVCPSDAFTIGPDDRIQFDATRCVGCGLCVPACPPRAMEVSFNE
jgi:ferredoxin